MKTSRLGIVVCASVALVAQPASASLVQIVGGFTSFSGNVGGCGGFISTTINGIDVTPTTGCDPVTFQAPLTMSLGTAQSVKFSTQPWYESTDQLRNLIAFTPAPPQQVAAKGDIFWMGTFTFENGIWNGYANFQLSLKTSSLDPLFNGHPMDVTVQLLLTSNTGTPQQNADTIYISEYTSLGSFRVYELADSPIGTNVGKVQLYGKIGSLIPVYFTDPDGGFLNSSVTAELDSPVPEPATWFAGLAMAVGWIARRRGLERNVRCAMDNQV